MAASLAIFLKDVREFLDGWRPITLAIITPTLLVLVLGQLRTQPTTFRVLLTNEDSSNPELLATAAILRESSQFEIEIASESIPDPLSALQEDGRDLVCVFDDAGQVRAYSALTDPFRAALLARSIEQVRTAHGAAREWIKGKSSTTETLALFGNDVRQWTAGRNEDEVILRVFQPLDWSNDVARVSRVRDVWRQAVALKKGPMAAALATLLSEQTERAAVSLTKISHLKSPPDAALLERTDAELASVETLSKVASETPELRSLATEPNAGDNTNDQPAIAMAIETVRLARAQERLDSTLHQAVYLDPDFVRRVRGLQKRAAAANAGTGRAELSREARDLVSLASTGAALSAANGPTLMNSLLKKQEQPTLTFFYPLALERPKAFLPEIVALVVCFLPFVIAAQSLLREREARTAEVLLATPGVTPLTLFIGKLGLPMLVGLINFFLAVVLLQLVHHLYVKPGLLDMMLVLLPAVLASTLIGLAASASADTAAQATIVSAVYLLMITLFSGFLYPISSQNPWVLSLVSSLSPLTFVHPAMKTWMFGAPAPVFAPLVGLVVQCLAFGAIATWAYRRWIRSI